MKSNARQHNPPPNGFDGQEGGRSMITGMISPNIQIVPKTIGEMLKGKRLEVPPSQRSYRWKTEHVEDLLQDIRTAIEDNADEYFLGSIVSIESNGRIMIYDGQQRLATAMILIAERQNKLAKLAIKAWPLG
jgi:ferredoxin-fold anticodon binding domain-containing protein